jgi:hypothetical protein
VAISLIQPVVPILAGYAGILSGMKINLSEAQNDLESLRIAEIFSENYVRIYLFIKNLITEISTSPKLHFYYFDLF